MSRGRRSREYSARAAELATTPKRPSRTSSAVTPSVSRSASAALVAAARVGRERQDGDSQRGSGRHARDPRDDGRGGRNRQHGGERPESARGGGQQPGAPPRPPRSAGAASAAAPFVAVRRLALPVASSSLMTAA